MTLPLSDLKEFKRRENNDGCLTAPPTGFTPDLREYMQRIQKEAGWHPATWPPDAEVWAAIAALENLFRTRRTKVLLLASDKEVAPDKPRMFPFEWEAYQKFRGAFETMERATGLMIMGEKK